MVGFFHSASRADPVPDGEQRTRLAVRHSGVNLLWAGDLPARDRHSPRCGRSSPRVGDVPPSANVWCLNRYTTKPSPLGLTGAIICFTILIAAVIFGIIVIIFGKQLFG